MADTPKQEIQKRLVAAMKSGDDVEKRTLKMIKAEILNEETKAGAAEEVSTEVFQKILQTMVKKRKQSITEFEKGGRPELAESEKEEIAVLETFLPEAIGEAEIAAAVDEILGSGEFTMKDMGRVIGQVMGKFKGANIDGTVVSGVVKSKLS